MMILRAVLVSSVLVTCLCVSGVHAAQPWTLITLGDSLTEGVGDDRWDEFDAPLGHPGRLLQMLIDAGLTTQLYNLGVSGWTSQELIDGTSWNGAPGQLGVAESLSQTAVAQGRRAVALVWIGSNDLFGLYGWKCNAASPASCADTDLQEYSANIETILNRLRAAGALAYIARLDDQSRRPVVAEPAYADSLPDITADELPLMSAQVERYNQAISTLANRYGAVVVDFFHTTLFENASTLSVDGNHPNGQGYDLIADIWHRSVTAPRADMLANASNGPLVVPAGTALDLSLNLDAGTRTGAGADWWLVRLCPDGTFGSYDLATKSFKPGLAPSYQGPVVDLVEFSVVVSTAGWASGNHTLYFGIDSAADGQLNTAPVYDWLPLQITP